ncbi:MULTISPECIES: metal ABC transporter substrate-binding protein [unclassified Ornithinimicrobium]|uniref:metal ABC transporter substrate-binding protein n=1 Tax=unclassified Ornithinimicrobium TaxID=2615080 RepID=UPI0038542C9F
MPYHPRSRSVLAALPLALVLASCGGGADGDTGTGTGATSGGAGAEPLSVVASFYPLQYLTQQVAGEHAEVDVLTSPGVDPHEVELSPRQIAELGSADLVVVLAGLQPAVDEAVAQQSPQHTLDIADAADLLALGESTVEHDEHVDAGADDGHDHGAEDPHFWLDPLRYADAADAVAARLAEVDPENADAYLANAEALVAELTTLDGEFQRGLATCETRDVVTTHEAFGYLGHRYDLNVIGITGISPESEPSPARLAEVTAQVRDLGVGTIFTEPLLPPGIAETVAQETGASVLTLDPVEGINDASAGADYLGVMRANLAALRDGLVCS